MNKRYPRAKRKSIDSSKDQQHKSNNKKSGTGDSDFPNSKSSKAETTTTGLSSDSARKDESSDIITDSNSWIAETQSFFEFDLDLPIVPFRFDYEFFSLDSIVLLETEALDYGWMESNSQMQWIMP